MKAVYTTSKGKIEILEKEKPTPKKGEVLIKIDACGICGSDVHYWQNGRVGKYIVEKPMVLGHESAGTVVELGEGVTNLKVGDLVAIEPGVPCMECEHCRAGRHNLCQNIFFFATPPDDGSMQEYVAHPAELCYKAPEGMPAEIATLAEPFSVAVFATNRVQIKLGDKVIVYGAGIIGVCMMIAAFENGASEVTIVDVNDKRLKFAKEMGATRVVNTGTAPLEDIAVFDVAFECTGAEPCLQSAVKAVKIGGKIGLVGMGALTQQVPIVDITCNEITLIPSFRYWNVYADALNVIGKYQDKFKNLITHHYSIDEAETAFNTAKFDPDAIKVMVEL